MGNGEQQHKWGDVAVGDHVTTHGRHGAGQPVVTGIVVEFVNMRQAVVIRPDDGSDNRRRSVSNVRRIDVVGWQSGPYWLGVATTFAFMQADLDTEANAEAGHRSPVLSARLPYLEAPSPEDLVEFGKAVSELNEEASILYWRLVRTDSFGEHYIEFVGTEGYLGWLPPGDPERKGWNC